MEKENNNFVQAAIPRFDGHYDHWSMLMENLLRSKEFWEVVEDGIPSLPEAPAVATPKQIKAVKDAKLKDLKAKNYLFQAIDRGTLETILKRNTAKEIWDSMKQKNQGSTKVRRAQLQALQREFEVLCMKEEETVNEYFARTLSIVNKMKMHGEQVTECIVVEKILRSMTVRFNYVVCSIEESNDVTTMSIDELQSSLLVHEQRMKGYKDEEQALKVSNSEKNGGRGRGRGNYRGGRGRGRQGFSKEMVECYRCHKLGHFQYECPNLEENANYAEFDKEEEMLLMAKGETLETAHDKVWFLDSSCSNHMCGNKDWFFEIDDTFRETVKLGDNSKMIVKGKGNVRMKINEITHVITGVYFIPELKNNLLSLGQLQEKGLTIILKDNMCKLYHEEKGLIVLSRMASNRLFAINVVPVTSSCLQTSIEGTTKLWHQRYGHLSVGGLKLLVQKKMVKGLPELNNSDEVCSDCMVGKQHRESIPKTSNWRASQKLELVHADICGPIKPESNSKRRYFLTFIDDSSRKTWVYFLVEKSDALDSFKKFKVMVEKQSGKCICCLRTDRGGEFNSAEFIKFCEENGIKRQLTTAYTPQQNGVAERKNRTLMNLVRSMLSARQVPKVFWPEAVNWANYVLNRSPTLAVKDVTPEEAWSGVKPSVHHFRIFRCVAHMHIPDAQRRKLDDKSKRCVLLGVSEESKAYRLYDPATKKVVTSRDVVFSENEAWNWGTKNTTTSEIPLEEEQTESAEEITPAEQIATDMVQRNEASPIDNRTDVKTEQIEETANDTTNQSIAQSKLKRNVRPLGWLDIYDTGNEYESEELHNLVMLGSIEDPVEYEETTKYDIWKIAMDDEIKAIERNNTWDLTTLPNGAKSIGVKWIYKTKYNKDGKVEKYKARLVAKGYTQKYGVDYNEVFAPVARWDTIRSILAIAAIKGWKVFQLDVKSAFLHGELCEEVYIDQPPGYVTKGEEGKVYRLYKALYGLKQAPRAWYSKIETYFSKAGFLKCPYEHTLFTKIKDGNNILIVSLYVDDLIYTGNDSKMFEEFKMSMKNNFDMTDLGKMKYFLGIEVYQSNKGIFICQQKYAREILQRFSMQDSKEVGNPIVPGTKLSKDEEGEIVDATNYKRIVGSLMYLATTRPDLSFSISVISRFMEKPTEKHLVAAKRVLRYVKGTLEFGIMYRRSQDVKLMVLSDSDYAGDHDDRKSTSGKVFILGSGVVSWTSKKQPIVTLSTTEAEYVAAASCVCQGI